MKALTTLGVGLLLPCLTFASGALAPITLTESTLPVTVGGSVVNQGEPVISGRPVRTAASGRAELGFGADRALRLGADTEVEMNLLGDTATLRRGSALLSGFNGGQRLLVEHADRTIIVMGDTAFVELAERAEGEGRVLVVGGMAGRVTVRGLGGVATLKPGELCALDETGAITRGQFNLPKQVATSALINDFQFPLVGMSKVWRAVNEFASHEARGFVRSADAAGTMVASRKLNRTGGELATLAIPQGSQGAPPAAGTGAGGTFNLAGLSVMDSSGVSKVGSGTLGLGANNFSASGASLVYGTLTLGSVIDFGGGNSSLTFANNNSYNWSGASTTGGNGSASGLGQTGFVSSGLTAGQLSQIRFFSDAGINFLGNGLFLGTEVVPTTGSVNILNSGGTPHPLTIGSGQSTAGTIRLNGGEPRSVLQTSLSSTVISGSVSSSVTLNLGTANVVQMEINRIIGPSGPPLPPTPLQSSQ